MISGSYLIQGFSGISGVCGHPKLEGVRNSKYFQKSLPNCVQDSRLKFFLLKTEHTKYLQSITIKTTIKTTSTIGINNKFS